MRRQDEVDGLVRIAAGNNAAWCTAVCRTHGLGSHQDGTRWWSGQRTPMYYPDAVSLDPDATSAAILADIDTSPGCSVKDSFDTLDLSADGFRPLFRAQWIHAPAGTFDSGSEALPPAWRAEVVRDDVGRRQWTDIFGDGGRELFRAALQHDRAVRLVLVFSGTEIAGIAALNRSPGAVGISNVVCTHPAAVSVWQAVGGLAATEFPDSRLVGYERDEDLEIASSAGFGTLGSLQVWMR